MMTTTLKDFISDNLRSLIKGYVDAIYFTESGMDGVTYDSPLSPELQAQIESDCQSFLTECWKYGFLYPDFDAELLGHNFWLNRNGHGSGFWDSKDIYGDEYAEKLSNLSKSYREFFVYAGDDGQLHS